MGGKVFFTLVNRGWGSPQHNVCIKLWFPIWKSLRNPGESIWFRSWQSITWKQLIQYFYYLIIKCCLYPDRWLLAPWKYLLYVSYILQEIYAPWWSLQLDTQSYVLSNWTVTLGLLQVYYLLFYQVKSYKCSIVGECRQLLYQCIRNIWYND